MTGYTGLVANNNFNQTAVGIQAYLVPYVTPAGATLTLRQQSMYTQFFTSGITKSATVTGFAPLGVFDANGPAFKAKGNLIEWNPLIGSKYPLATSDFEASVEGVIADIDSAHFQTLFGSTTNEVITIAAGVGQTGLTNTFFGNGKVLKQYTLMLRYPSVIVPPGQGASSGTVPGFDDCVFPRVVIVPELDMKFAKKDPTTAKISWQIISDMNFVSPDSGTPFLGWKAEVTTAAT